MSWWTLLFRLTVGRCGSGPKRDDPGRTARRREQLFGHFDDDREYVVGRQEVVRRLDDAVVGTRSPVILSVENDLLFGGRESKGRRGCRRTVRVVHVVTIRNDLEELGEVEEERIAPWPDEDFNAALQLGDRAKLERTGLGDERIARSDLIGCGGSVERYVL